MTEPVAIAADRSMLVPPGRIVKTGYVDVFKVRHACRERMSVGDVAAAYQKSLQVAEGSAWPCPNGHWDGNVFVIHDGRHEWVSAVMIGRTHILVAWLEDAPRGEGRATD